MATTTYGTPYVQSSDLVSGYPSTSNSLATRVDDVSLKGNGVNTQTGTTYTLVLTDGGKTVTTSNAAAVTVTIPLNSSVAFPTGVYVTVLNLGAGTMTVQGAGGVTLNGSGTSCAQYEATTLRKTASDTWVAVKGGPGKASVTATTGSPTVTTVSGKTCYQFTGSGSITIGGNGGLCDVLVVGAGGGGARTGGGGGGGGVVAATIFLSAATHTITVGGGGPGTNDTGNNNPGRPGNGSQVATVRSAGGGGGGVPNNSYGLSGANSGGWGPNQSGTDYSNSLFCGFIGGGSTASGGGGGGGDTANGGAAATNTGGAGGAGRTSSITGSSVGYGGGGGGGGSTTGGTASNGGGAGGGNTSGTAGGTNLGGGGGGGWSGAGANGGSGTVIVLIG